MNKVAIMDNYTRKGKTKSNGVSPNKLLRAMRLIIRNKGLINAEISSINVLHEEDICICFA